MRTNSSQLKNNDISIDKDSFAEFYKYFFICIDDSDNHKCRICDKVLKWKAKTGYSNAKSHLNAVHRDWKDDWARAQDKNTIEVGIAKYATRTVSDDALSLFKWLYVFLKNYSTHSKGHLYSLYQLFHPLCYMKPIPTDQIAWTNHQKNSIQKSHWVEAVVLYFFSILTVPFLFHQLMEMMCSL